jgi:hypothetical protein
MSSSFLKHSSKTDPEKDLPAGKARLLAFWGHSF